jgi:hypothetical protein
VAAGVAHGVAIAVLLASDVANFDGLTGVIETPSLALVEMDLAPFEKTVINGVSPERPSRQRGVRRDAKPPSVPRAGRYASVNDRVDLHGPLSDSVESALSDAEHAPSEFTATSTDDDPRSLTLEQLGITGPERLALRSSSGAISSREPTEGARAPSADGVLRSMRQLAQDHDRKVGLSAGGTVTTAFENVVYQSSKLVVGKATFEVVVIDNKVSSISVMAVQGAQPSEWNLVAKNAAVRLARSRIRVPPGRRGIVLQIQVESRVALPSGHDPGVEVTVGPVLVQRGQGPRSARLGILVPNTSAPEEIEARNRSGGLPSPVGGVNFVSTDIDPVDLGAKGRHVVHAYTADETLLD